MLPSESHAAWAMGSVCALTFLLERMLCEEAAPGEEVSVKTFINKALLIFLINKIISFSNPS